VVYAAKRRCTVPVLKPRTSSPSSFTAARPCAAAARGSSRSTCAAYQAPPAITTMSSATSPASQATGLR